MASTWSALKVELQGTGDNPGTWGTATNANLGDAVLGEAITGSATVDFASDADVTITLTDFATTQAARNLRLNITESSTGIGSVRNLILGSGCQIEKFYLINNTGTGAKTIKNTSGTGISVPAGKATLVYNNGTNVVDAASYFTSLTLGSALPVASGGTGLTAGTSGGVLAYTASGTLASSAALTQYGVVYGGGAGVAPSATAVGTATHVLTSNGSGVAPTFQAIPASGVTTFTAGTTGFTPNTATSGAVTLAGTLATANGGTNLGGATPFTSGGVVYASSTSALATGSALTFNGTNLGIGTSSPSSKIEAVAGTGAQAIAVFRTGDATAANNAGGGFNATSSATAGSRNARMWLDADGANFSGGDYFFIDKTGNNGNVELIQASNAAMTFQTNSTERARIDASGNLGVGTTNPAASGARLVVTPSNTTGSSSYLTFDCTNFSDSNFQINITGTAATDKRAVVGTTTTTALAFQTNSAERARISAAGGFSVGTTSDPGAGAIYATGAITAFFSDKRLKTVSGKIENALDKVAKLSGVYYTFNDTAKSFGYDSDEVQVGVLAQDVEAVLPQIVKAAPFDLDENNNSKSGENYKTVQYEKLVPLLIEAINELQAKVKLLENK